MNRGPMLFLGALGVLGLMVAGGAPARRVRRLGETMEGQLGRFFTWAELTASTAASRLGLVNQPTPAAQQAMALLVGRVLDPLRAGLGRPVRVTSGYRSPAVNQAVKGARSSQHMLGEAADIKVDGVSAIALATAVLRLGLPFDQLIWYDPARGGHVHVSFTARRANRGETLHAPAGGGYRPWTLT